MLIPRWLTTPPSLLLVGAQRHWKTACLNDARLSAQQTQHGGSLLVNSAWVCGVLKWWRGTCVCFQTPSLEFVHREGSSKKCTNTPLRWLESSTHRWPFWTPCMLVAQCGISKDTCMNSLGQMVVTCGRTRWWREPRAWGL